MAPRLLLLALVFTLHSVAASRQMLQSCPPSFYQAICAPSYKYPCSIDDSSCPWYSFSNGADIVIVNPNSGPGTGVMPEFTNLVSSIRAKPESDTYITSILGYVATGYGSKSLTNAKAEIDKYNSYYKVDGIFLDEVSIDCATTAYYSSLVQYVRSTTKSPTGQDFTILNWGTNGPQCFLTASTPADTFVTFENSYSSYQTYSPAAYMANYSPSRWYNIVYGVTESNLVATLTKSKYNRAGYVYVTNDDGPNPYDTAPSPYTTYWRVEVDKVAQTC